MIGVLIPSQVLAEKFANDSNYGLGIFMMRSQSPGPSLRFSMPYIFPSRNKSGWTTYIGADWTNVWAEKKNYTLDYEMLDIHAAVSYCFNSRFELGFFMENRFFFGGEMDNAIEKFHDLFDIAQDGRDESDQNLSRVILRDDQGTVLLEYNAEKFENNGVGLFVQYTLHHGNTRWPSISVNGQMRYALKEPDAITDDDQPLDMGIGIGLSKGFCEKWHTYFNLNFTYYGQTEFDGLAFDNNSLSGILALSYGWTPKFSLLIQYIFHEGVIHDLDSLDKYSHEVIMGFKWLLTHGGVVELGLIENIIDTDNSADVGLHFAYTYRF